jgi:polyhydroxybutyrate depolymerase
LLISLYGQSQTINKTLVHNGISRSYILYIPANYSPTNPLPLVLNFHGFGGSSSQQMSMANFKPIADTANFIVACPQGTLYLGLGHWNVGGWTASSTVNDVDFTKHLIDSISSLYSIDPTRVYATGFSNGGFFSHKLALELGPRIAAIASVAGSFTQEMMNNAAPTHPMPVLQIHGTNDGTVAYNGSTTPTLMLSVDSVLNYWVNYNNCNTTPTVTPLPDINTNDASTVERIVYQNGNNNTRVEHLKITGGTHTWPGFAGNMDINACLEIWKFFSQWSYAPLGVSGYHKEKQEISLYPNPMKNTIHFKNLINDPIHIYDVTGRLVFSDKIVNSTIDISHLPNGQYFLRIQDRPELKGKNILISK